MHDDNPVPPGRHRHYKGREYTVLGTARHSQTLEAFVVPGRSKWTMICGRDPKQRHLTADKPMCQRLHRLVDSNGHIVGPPG